MTTNAITPTLSALDAGGHGSTLGLIVALTLATLLIAKDIAIGASDAKQDKWNAALNVAIVPLAMTFLLIAIASVKDVLAS